MHHGQPSSLPRELRQEILLNSNAHLQLQNFSVISDRPSILYSKEQLRWQILVCKHVAPELSRYTSKIKEWAACFRTITELTGDVDFVERTWLKEVNDRARKCRLFDNFVVSRQPE